MVNHCESPDATKLCGKPWDCPETTLVTSISNLRRTINRQRSDNMIPTFVSPYMKGRRLFFAIIFKPVDRASNYRVVQGLDTAAMEAEIETMNGNRFYVVYATSYIQKGKILHLVVFQRMNTPTESNFYLAQSESDYRRRVRTNRGSCVESLAVTQNAQGSLNYTVLYKQCDDNTAVLCGLTSNNLVRRINRQRNRGFKLTDISAYTISDETQFCAVFSDEKIGECEYTVVHSFSEEEINNIAKDHKKDGYRIVAIVVHSQTSFPLFMAVFKK